MFEKANLSFRQKRQIRSCLHQRFGRILATEKHERELTVGVDRNLSEVLKNEINVASAIDDLDGLDRIEVALGGDHGKGPFPPQVLFELFELLLLPPRDLATRSLLIASPSPLRVFMFASPSTLEVKARRKTTQRLMIRSCLAAQLSYEAQPLLSSAQRVAPNRRGPGRPFRPCR
jgi:hypothetical protein